ncbi:MAG: hypothetical protein ACKO6B_11945 [Planctomycetia bacterium]
MSSRSTVALVLLHFAATAFMTGLIWYVQVVHYPLMAGWLRTPGPLLPRLTSRSSAGRPVRRCH